jgi:tRNA A-37 threonylcarbamoyl transferase component Bud32
MPERRPDGQACQASEAVPSPASEPAPATAQALADPEPLARAEALARQLPSRAGAALQRSPALWAVPVLAGLLVMSLLVRLLRGRGDVAVAIDLPADRRGTFSVRLARQRERRHRPARGEAPSRVPSARASSRFEHNMVARETHFLRIPARRYYAVLDGVLEAEAGGAAEAVYEEVELRVQRGRVVRMDFDLRPKRCLVEVRVVRSGRPAREARVALGGDPTSIRFAPGGVARLSLPEGPHAVLVGSEDRVCERTVEVEDLASRTLLLDLDDSADRVFTDCPGAVEPYLRGDLSVAAAALERSGQDRLAHLLAARFHQDRGDSRAAAERFEAGGRWIEAAEIFAGSGEIERSASLFDRAGDHARAGEMYNAAGDLVRAGRAYAQAGDLDAAIICYRDADEKPLLMEALEKKGDHFGAGCLALEQNEIPLAVRNLQLVDSRHAEFFYACRSLAEIFSREGKPDLAVQKADEAMSVTRPEDTSADTLVWYGEILSSAHRHERALKIFEDLRERAPELPALDTRIEELRKKLSAVRRGGGATLPHGTDTAFATDRYEFIEEIGRGGMGVVFRARDRRLGREVAVKRLPENLKEHPRAVELFLREARAAAALNHPNIVTVHDVDQDDGSYFLTMELLVGTPLSDVVRARRRISPRDATRLGLQVAAGLGYAHGQRIVHRDIKTANLFFTSDKVVKIMDFGLAKPMEEVRRASTLIGGTPYYMAPEQAAGGVVDHRADLYGFGATLFELVSGRPPFTDGDVTYHHRHTAPPDLRERADGVPDTLATLVADLLAKHPSERPQNADEVTRRLQAIAAEP